MKKLIVILLALFMSGCATYYPVYTPVSSTTVTTSAHGEKIIVTTPMHPTHIPHYTHPYYARYGYWNPGWYSGWGVWGGHYTVRCGPNGCW